MIARTRKPRSYERDPHDGFALIRIRVLRAHDIPACGAIVGSDALWQRYGISARKARQLIRDARRRRERLYVATADGQVVGFIWFLLHGTFAHSGYIRWIVVASSARGKGVGTKLMAFAETQILRAGPNVFLLVSAFNRLAQRFYWRRGYQPIGRLADYVAPGITEVLYRKTTGPPRPRPR